MQLSVSSDPAAGPLSGNNFDYIVTILLENHNLCQLYTGCGGVAVYLSSFANNWSLAKNYSALVHPSLGNYIALTSGNTYGVGDGHTPGTVNHVNIVDRLIAANLTWKAYMENYNGGCSGLGGTNYTNNHNPFIMYSDIFNNASRCARIVNTGIEAYMSTSPFLTDMNSANPPNYMWLSPQKCNDMHDNCIGGYQHGNGSIQQGDFYMFKLVPKIMSSTLFTTRNAALFIVTDEGVSPTPYPTDLVYTVWAGPPAKTHFSSLNFYGHYSYVSTLDSNWGWACLSLDCSAPSMNEFFGSSNPDKTPPTIAIGSPANNSVLTSTTVTVSGTASDDVAVQKVELSTDGTTWRQAAGTTSWSGTVTLGIDTNAIYARATDLSANAMTSRITVTVNLGGPGTPPSAAPVGPGFSTLLVVEIPLAIFAATFAGVLLFLWRRNRAGEPTRERNP